MIKSNRYYLYLKQLEDMDYNLSQQTCIFKINSPFIRDHFLVLSMFIKPLTGLFQEIEFRPQMYINLVNNFEPPKILNDRKIYHPNIDFING